jgi:deazaflavin-dependent oxidoreductase (nitroreductase family)
MPMLILATKGRRSGRVHSVPLGYMMERDSYVVIASYRGSPSHPAWYLNLLSEPQAIVQVNRRRIAVVARTADAEAKERLWTCLVTRTPLYKRFQERTTRQIPMVYLTPVTSSTER